MKEYVVHTFGLTPRMIVVSIALLVLLFYFVFIAPPFSFPVGVLISVEEGMTLSEVSKLLKGKNIIHSRLFFEMVVWITGGEKSIISGDYFFAKKQTIFAVSSRLLGGRYGLELLKVTVPEGSSVAEIALIFEKRFLEFDTNEFIRIASRDEGYLFPDTYFFLPNVKADQVHREMKENFNDHVESISNEMKKSEKGLHTIITMASLLEKEARMDETRKIIAGILWKRLSLEMPLQVDAVFGYINGKNTFNLTLDDLQIDSPYNTYKYKGLPPGPITNPGMDSILAALQPTSSPYFFYLSDHNGTTHYAITFEEHKINKARYLP